ncbi:MAG: HAD family hydrolase [Kiritimatiellae bacterium]|nr:HAD family hydrolase [Kiritimatiellia bacterium]
MGSILGIIFDLDGTLLDTLEDIADSMNAVLARHGWPVHEPDAYRYFVGDGIEELVRRSLPGGLPDDGRVEECLATMRREYADRWSDKTRPYDGIPELLDALERRGVKMAVLSNKPDHFTREMVEYYFGLGRFVPAFGTRSGVPPKPDPTASFEIARQLGIEPTHFAHVGDTPVDMQTARAADMLAVGVTWGFRPAEELRAAGAEVLVDHPRNVLALLDAP